MVVTTLHYQTLSMISPPFSPSVGSAHSFLSASVSTSAPVPTRVSSTNLCLLVSHEAFQSGCFRNTEKATAFVRMGGFLEVVSFTNSSPGNDGGSGGYGDTLGFGPCRGRPSLLLEMFINFCLFYRDAFEVGQRTDSRSIYPTIHFLRGSLSSTSPQIESIFSN